MASGQIPNHLLSGGRFLPLDGLRGIAAIFVVIFHFFMFFVSEQARPIGYLSVDFFFILSGFILAYKYEDAIAVKAISLVRFALRRWMRLWPVFFISLLLLMWIQPYVDYRNNPAFWNEFFIQILLLSSLLMLKSPWNGPTWSVSVEWVVNIAFFIWTRLFGKLPLIILILLLVVNIGYMLSISSKTNLFIPWSPIYNFPIARGLAGFIMGIVLFRLHMKLPCLPAWALHALEAILILLIATTCAFNSSLHGYYRDYAYLLIVFPALIMLALYKKSWTCRIFSLKPVVGLGTISYSLYCLHLPLGELFRRYDRTIDWWPEIVPRGILFMAFLILCSFLCWLLVERPARRLLKAKQ